jgi:MFS superfamily sulfate permease-like transporter
MTQDAVRIPSGAAPSAAAWRMTEPTTPSTVPSASWVRTHLSPYKNLRADLPASLVVFLVALPLCLGIALASGAPLISGIISGIIGGIVVGSMTGSALSVSGPAAGLTVIVLTAISDLGSFEAFLLALVLAGVMQVGLGFVRAGIVAYYFPSSVIKGMLAAIGIILILKQIPYAVGFSADYEGSLAFLQQDGRNTLTEIPYALGHFHLGATLIALAGLTILIAMDRRTGPRRIKWMPPQLVVVLVGIALNESFRLFAPALANENDLVVAMPALSEGLGALLMFPDFSRILDPMVWKVAGTLAIIASVETLLCIEAVDRLDPFRRRSDTDRELRAQGIGNTLAGLIGGLPMTAVIVRGSANIQAGARTQASSVLHGILLFVSIAAIPEVLSRIPLAALAAVLMHIGYKLAQVSLFRNIYRQGKNQFIPFIVTITAIVFTDLLIGVAIGMVMGVFFILKANLATPYFMHYRESYEKTDPRGNRQFVRIVLSENVSFLNKASVGRALRELPDRAIVEIDGSSALYIDRDVLEIVHDFAKGAQHRGIEVRLVDIPPADAHSRQLLERKPTVVHGPPRPASK